jgi:VanZ family protein
MKHFLFKMLQKYWKSITWIFLILFLSAISGNDLKKVQLITIPHFDKIVHFGMYFILTAVLILDFIEYRLHPINQKLNFKTLFFILIFSLFYGILMELMQEYVFEKRSADYYDFLANASGSFIALFFRNYWLKYFKMLEKQ